MSFVVPTIPSPNPVTIPAEGVKTFPDLWIHSFNIIVPSLSTGYVRLELLPYNASVPEILGGVPTTVLDLPLEYALSAVPTIQTIFDTLYNSISSFQTAFDTFNV